MKQYLLFSGDQYYPLGGWDDLTSTHDTLEEAKAAEKASTDDWSQLINSETGAEVF